MGGARSSGVSGLCLPLWGAPHSFTWLFRVCGFGLATAQRRLSWLCSGPVCLFLSTQWLGRLGTAGLQGGPHRLPAHRRAWSPPSPGPSPEEDLPGWALAVLRLRFGSWHCAPGLMEGDFTLGVFEPVIQDTSSLRPSS